MFGIFHNIRFYFKALFIFPIIYSDMLNQTKISDFTKILSIFTTKMIIDCIFHPLHLLESRFILQDARYDLKFYKNLKHLSNKIDRRQLFQGWRINFPINLVSILNFNLYIKKDNLTMNSIFQFFTNNIILYPLITVRRRLDCQDYNAASMLRPRYEGVRHCLKLMFYEEGFKGLYRGFGAFNLNMFFIYSAIALVGKEGNVL